MNTINVNVKDLINLSKYASKDETRKVICSIYLDVLSNKFVATDGYRLSCLQIEGDLTDWPQNILIDKFSLTKILKELAKQKIMEAKLSYSEGKIYLNEYDLILIEGNFVPYQQVIPKKENLSFEISINKDLIKDIIANSGNFFTLHIGDNNKAFIVEGDNNFIQVLMPVNKK